MMKKGIFILLVIFVLPGINLRAQSHLKEKIYVLAEKKNDQTIQWRREIHQNPELSNREFKTAEKVARHLSALGLEVKTKVAHTGVVGILKGGKPGKVVALRADMDALPVVERVNVPYASKVRSTYNGQEVGVMHACGHDTHVAILMSVAEILTELKDEIAGTVKFIFQPAEEGAPQGEEGGAKMMVEQGVMKNPVVDVVFGLHISSKTEVGKIRYVPGATMAAVDMLKIKVKGAQTHGAYPWEGIDPVATSAQIISGLQQIVSRQVPLIKAPAVVTVATVHGGVRNNIIPEEIEMTGTIRNLDMGIRDLVHKRIHRIVTNIAESNGAVAEVQIIEGYPVTYNNPDLTAAMLPTLEGVAGKENVVLSSPVMGAEDFSYYAMEAPGLFFSLGGMPKGQDPREAAPHHTPDFFIDDSGLVVGVKALASLAVDYLGGVEVGK